ncbi:hypothetical protein PMAYCL1PPCAC_33426 [Pristionchus mayeri]|uniref:Uncharacterized protein n=1 Tax=Pristionchus mayeri TaxID=1317129 RepID=A0AAN5I2W3_9BILA|nr:hypothetical protein PMAYCL1PPCAC_19919 [Pristionchus mayeri]GMR63231.1 hypothetical protein PMAYCL1PPCAC_33426 [Pristionchus mayeri]
MIRVKEVSTRLMRPTLPSINLELLEELVTNWNKEWEADASVKVFDEGLAQYMLVDELSHHKFYAAVILGKPALRCTLVDDEPEDKLDEDADNEFALDSSPNAREHLDRLMEILSKRGYRFRS